MSMKELTPATEHTTVLAFPELVGKVKKRHDSIAVNPRYQKSVAKLGVQHLQKLEHLLKRNVIRVDLEIPKELVAKLRSNKVFRKGGILRRTDGKQIVRHLKDVKPSKVCKLATAANIAFVAIDILETALLDEKLKAILEVVKSVEAKLDAQNRGKLKGALAAMHELGRIHDPETKRQRINLIQHSLKEAEWIFREEYENRWKKYSLSSAAFDSARMTNASEVAQMQAQANELVDDLEPVILCQVTHTQLYVELNEYIAAEKGAEDSVTFVAENVERFKNAFSGASLDERQPKHKKLLRFRKRQQFTRFRENVLEPNERIENLLNQTIMYSLTIPEEIVAHTKEVAENAALPTSERPVTFWDRLAILWLRFVYKVKAWWREL